jgi:murein DD-endopeptidase MepM/ murein hydrolase activator NlpD
VVIFLVLVVMAVCAFMYNSRLFERTAPVVEIADEIHWNLKSPLTVRVTDDTGIKRALVQISDGENNTITLINEKYSGKDSVMEFNITFPKTGFYSKKNRYYLSFEVVDRSLWNFFMGNVAKRATTINVDTKRPNVYVVNNSYKITRGGSALVVFKADDENLKDVYVQTNFGKQFRAQPFVKDGYYIALLAWPVAQKSFAADIIAHDHAGNTVRNHIKFFLQDKNYRTSKINLTDNFLNNSVAAFAEEIAPDATAELGPIEKFVYINEKIRAKSVEVVTNRTAALSNIDMFKRLRPFVPLRNGAVVAGFGDYRVYEYKGAKVSQSYHLGLDMASTAEAEIALSNSGRVAYADYNGIYGNMLLIDHGLGLYSLYGHCSSLMVNDGSELLAGQLLGHTGKTGFVFGDHLHFGIVLQGIEVRPEEWLDEKWMKDNIFDLIESSTKTIQAQK